MSIHITDTNRYHPLTDGVAYSKFSPIIIIEAGDGLTADSTYGTQRALVKKASGIVSTGHYWFVRPTEDVRAQGTLFARTIIINGGFRVNDFLSWDIEVDPSGQTDLRGVANTFINAVHSVLHEKVSQDFGYSDESFWKAHLYAVNNVHKWIAAYGQADPGMGETLWQNSDATSVPGVAGEADCSVFNGTLQQFLALVNPQPTPQPTGEEEVFIIACEGQPTFLVLGGVVVQVPDQASTTEWLNDGAKLVRVDAAMSAQFARKAAE